MINLDEARVARREEAKDAPTLKFGGTEYELPVELPLETVEALGGLAKAGLDSDGAAVTAALLATVRSLVGSRFDEFMEDKPSLLDLTSLVEGIASEYGASLPESSASEEPSESTTEPPKQHSAQPTA